MNTATWPELGDPTSAPWSTSHVPAGVFTAELGSETAAADPPAAIAALVALATACTEGDARPAAAVAPDSSASSGSAEEDARIRSPDASSSTTPGASERAGGTSQGLR